MVITGVRILQEKSLVHHSPWALRGKEPQGISISLKTSLNQGSFHLKKLDNNNTFSMDANMKQSTVAYYTKCKRVLLQHPHVFCMIYCSSSSPLNSKLSVDIIESKV